ncbi:TetR/AcrR family transcriptional regulator [Paenibacillus sp. YPG26]|uniref:TetR/AcrR family transcriptional regulator n=1 Tax=Paenibacillus sp. YPG26 TaxID=2878915 RepID=UPI00203AE498|nr:TetR/AcrR family transcriptional regulator [Paenibacillus sp. YPG26]USB32912.1 TetR/AcrR family transcriptional regulator [Paenibacillus sp. YPG26]
MTTGRQRIQEAALAQFARDGYEGASLQQIAAAAGIKKPSIYAHFKGKEDLYMSVLGRVFRKEKHRIVQFFLSRQRDPLEERLQGLFVMLQEEYERNEDMKFLLRMLFFPPHAIRDEVIGIIYPFLDSLERKLIKLMEAESRRGTFQPADIHQAAIAYMTLADGIMVELLYSQPERSRTRLEAAWPIYWEGITGQSDRQ